ncbi:sensor histidine kinase [Pseudolysinimonas sp.]|jgi:two-component system OmpR family sensor kinase|uniref:sensor histidine kinase n=1 Tax=Pseudolysinimonas sp. TaxID=2680009 RepID=UPI003784A422
MRRLSIRARITLGSVLVAVVLLAGALLVVRGQTAHVLAGSDAALATGDLTAFVADISADPEGEVDDPGTGVLVAIVSPAGVVQVDTLPHDVREVVDGQDPRESEFRMTDDEGRGFVVVGRIVETDAGEWMLWAARSTSASELALEGLGRLLIVGGVLLLVGFAGASWVLATVALRPVTRMRVRAEGLGATLDGELPIGRADDELAALARTLNDLLARVRAATAREKQMVSDAAHELRTPLAALRTQLELAHRDFGDADALARHVRDAEFSATRLASLAGNLLELSRLDAEGDKAVRVASATDLVAEFLGAVDRARLLALASSTEVAFEVAEAAVADRYGLDAASFGRLADNLLANAVSAAPGGNVEARLSLNADGLTLVVSDDGPGMPPEFVPHAFERFTRPDAARTSQAGGSGLGLALVRAIASAADGTAEVANTPTGFAATVRLPKM